jgi:hypothetical protein
VHHFDPPRSCKPFSKQELLLLLWPPPGLFVTSTSTTFDITITIATPITSTSKAPRPLL